jgi:molybdopterin molybdotransferase
MNEKLPPIPAAPRRPAGRDVRMRGFASRTTVEAALAWLDQHLAPLPAESIPLHEAAGRVLAEDVASRIDVPSFDRAMMDGFALHADDTLGAGAYNPLELNIVGRSLPGRPFAGNLVRGQAAFVMTGAPLPPGADAVLPAELAEVDGERLLVQGDVPPAKNVGRRGEDIAAGTVVLESGRQLRPQDVGVLSSVGLAEVRVVRRPRVRIIITGDELLAPGAPLRPHCIYDANGPMLRALVERDGGLPRCDGIVPDRPQEILAALRDPAADLYLLSGGSSVGEEDHAPPLVAEHGELAIHGIAMRPSSPSGLGLLDGRLVFLLPGNPVSCLCAYDFFAGRAIRVLGGRTKDWPYPRVRLLLARKISSVVGRVDYARVQIINGRVEPISISGASILSSTTRADGFVIIPADSEGYPPAAEVEVFLYEPTAGCAIV